MFAGAGCSVPAGYPSWQLLLERLENLCDICGGGFVRDAKLLVEDPLQYANLVKQHIFAVTGSLGRYDKFLMSTFGATPRLQQFHRDGVLPFTKTSNCSSFGSVAGGTV